MSILTREEIVNALVEQDIEDITQEVNNGECIFLESVLTDNGWKPYNQLTDKELEAEYNDRILSDEDKPIVIKP